MHVIDVRKLYFHILQTIFLYYFYLLPIFSFLMEKQPMTTSFDTPINFFPSSEKQIISNQHKIKNISNSTHRRTNQGSQKIMQRVSKLNNIQKQSTTRKHKSKCQTQAHQSTKKRTTQVQSISKKTLRKRKNPKLQNSTSNKLKLSHSKHEQESLTMKSNVKRNWPKKQLFHSTCFSRHIDHDLQMLQEVMHGSLDFLAASASCIQYSQGTTLQGVLQKTNLVLSKYQNRCEQLQKQCNFYKSQLNKANKKLQEYDKKKSSSKRNIKNKHKDSRDFKQSIRSTWGGRNQKY